MKIVHCCLPDFSLNISLDLMKDFLDLNVEVINKINGDIPPFKPTLLFT